MAAHIWGLCCIAIKYAVWNMREWKDQTMYGTQMCVSVKIGASSQKGKPVETQYYILLKIKLPYKNVVLVYRWVNSGVKVICSSNLSVIWYDNYI